MSVYKNFRNYRKREVDFNTLSNRFDQPTYLSFRLEFAENNDSWYNGAGVTWESGVNYDRMPHPLFQPKSSLEDIELRQNYSSVNYLEDANEHTRALMLEEFQNKWHSLQRNFQWYFQKIDGIEDLLAIDPKKGIRIPQDKRLTITSLEGVDLRMTHLLNMYRKIAWDDTYQRWVLPDMMRYFTLKIYISEFRTFHIPHDSTGMGGNKLGPYEYPTRYNIDTAGELLLETLDTVIPTWVIKCEMCEFDLEGINMAHLSSLGVDAEPEQAGIQFKIKVGKIFEEQYYPIFKNKYLIDKVLNGFDRSKTSDVESGGYNKEFNSTEEGFNNNRNKYGHSIIKAQNITDDEESAHVSGKPFQELANQDSMFGEKNPWISFDTRNEDFSLNFDSDRRDGWVDNGIKWGEAVLENAVQTGIDFAKVTPIPSLGLSYSEVKAAIAGKDVVVGLGLVKKSIDEIVNEAAGPSELLEKKSDAGIAEQTFRVVLETLSKSEATDEDIDKKALIDAANLAL
ncbi:hypothetical protein KY321_01550, partial [Candidatus Woesearchaeota archaeon]|nr:hypothetical protein [Candidatus Woesearchaeota archaeon]